MVAVRIGDGPKAGQSVGEQCTFGKSFSLAKAPTATELKNPATSVMLR